MTRGRVQALAKDLRRYYTARRRETAKRYDPSRDPSAGEAAWMRIASVVDKCNADPRLWIDTAYDQYQQVHGLRSAPPINWLACARVEAVFRDPAHPHHPERLAEEHFSYQETLLEHLHSDLGHEEVMKLIKLRTYPQLDPLIVLAYWVEKGVADAIKGWLVQEAQTQKHRQPGLYAMLRRRHPVLRQALEENTA